MIRIGPAGNCSRDTLSSAQWVADNDLGCQEIEFVYGITLNNSKAKEVGELAKKLDIKLSVHAPYYINLSSLKKETIGKSKKWILLSCERGNYMNGANIVFHPGFYHKRSKEEVFDIIVNEVKDLMKLVKEKKFKINLCPEVTGKKSAFGSIEETIDLVKRAKCSFCIDFAHEYARTQGKRGVNYVLDFLKSEKIKKFHSHFSCIKYSDKGEIKHLPLSAGKPDYKDLIKGMIKNKMSGTVICETPNLCKDAILMNEYLKS